MIGRVKHLFDLGAAPDSVSMVLRQDEILAPTVRRLPGLRVAGAFDGFELAVRTVLGQQVSIKGASTIAGRWAQAFGEPIATPFPELNHLSPSAERTAAVSAEEIIALGMVGARARCLIGLAQAVVERRIVLTFASNVEEQIEHLMRLPGIGHWTANYIAMRALHWPDAFPTGDLVLMRAAKSTQKQLQQRSEAWRPWRAYASPLSLAILRSRDMNFFCYVDSPIGRLMLTADGTALTGLYMNLCRNKPTKPAG